MNQLKKFNEKKDLSVLCKSKKFRCECYRKAECPNVNIDIRTKKLTLEQTLLMSIS